MIITASLHRSDDPNSTPVNLGSEDDVLRAWGRLRPGTYRVAMATADRRYAELIFPADDEADLVALIAHSKHTRHRTLLLNPIELPRWCDLRDTGRVPTAAIQWHPAHALSLARRWVTDPAWEATEFPSYRALHEYTWSEQPTELRYWDFIGPADADTDVAETLLIALQGGLASGLTVAEVLRLDEELSLPGDVELLAQDLDRAHEDVHTAQKRGQTPAQALSQAEAAIQRVLDLADAAGSVQDALASAALRLATCAHHLPDHALAAMRANALTAARSYFPANADLDE
ncbi:hypothetical protein [Microbacterium sp. NPDC055683]